MLDCLTTDYAPDMYEAEWTDFDEIFSIAKYDIISTWDQFLNDYILFNTAVKKPIISSKTSWLNGFFDISGILITYQVIMW